MRCREPLPARPSREAGRSGEAHPRPESRAAQNRFHVAGAECILAGLVVWAVFSISERSAAQQLAAKSLAVFGTESDPAGKQAVAEGQTQVQLFHADGFTRRAFLEIALQDSTD